MKLYYKSEKYRLYNLRKATRALERKSKAGSEIATKSVYAGRSGYAESEVLPRDQPFEGQARRLAGSATAGDYGAG